MTPIVAVGPNPFHRAHKELLMLVGDHVYLRNAGISRLNINEEDIDDVIVGCAYPEGEQGYNIGRMAVLLCNLPNSVPGMTINRLCGGSMQAAICQCHKSRSGGMLCCCWGRIKVQAKRRGFNWSPHSVLESGVTDAYISMGNS